MARKRYGSKKRRYDSSNAAPVRQAVPEPVAPVRSEKMQALIAAAEQAQSQERVPYGGFTPKPRAIRRFEKYANMGGE